MPLPPVPPPDLLKRLPGYYRRWELTELLLPDRFYFFEAAGQHEDGEPLFAVYIQSSDLAPGSQSAATTPRCCGLRGPRSGSRPRRAASGSGTSSATVLHGRRGRKPLQAR